MSSRHYRHSVTLWQKQRTRDADTGQRTDVWTQIGDPFRANIASDDASEQLLTDIGRNTPQRHRITLQDSTRSRAIDKTMQFRHEARTFEIIGNPGYLMSGRSRDLIFPVIEIQ